MITTGIKTEFQALTNAIIAPAIITSLIAGRKTRKYVLISLAPSIRLALINSDEKLSELCPNKYTKMARKEMRESLLCMYSINATPYNK